MPDPAQPPPPPPPDASRAGADASAEQPRHLQPRWLRRIWRLGWRVAGGLIVLAAIAAWVGTAPLRADDQFESRAVVAIEQPHFSQEPEPEQVRAFAMEHIDLIRRQAVLETAADDIRLNITFDRHRPDDELTVDELNRIIQIEHRDAGRVWIIARTTNPFIAKEAADAVARAAVAHHNQLTGELARAYHAWHWRQFTRREIEQQTDAVNKLERALSPQQIAVARSLAQQYEAAVAARRAFASSAPEKYVRTITRVGDRVARWRRIRADSGVDSPVTAEAAQRVKQAYAAAEAEYAAILADADTDTDADASAAALPMPPARAVAIVHGPRRVRTAMQAHPDQVARLAHELAMLLRSRETLARAQSIDPENPRFENLRIMSVDRPARVAAVPTPAPLAFSDLALIGGAILALVVALLASLSGSIAMILLIVARRREKQTARALAAA